DAPTRRPPDLIAAEKDGEKRKPDSGAWYDQGLIDLGPLDYVGSSFEAQDLWFDQADGFLSSLLHTEDCSIPDSRPVPEIAGVSVNASPWQSPSPSSQSTGCPSTKSQDSQHPEMFGHEQPGRGKIGVAVDMQIRQAFPQCQSHGDRHQTLSSSPSVFLEMPSSLPFQHSNTCNNLAITSRHSSHPESRPSGALSHYGLEDSHQPSQRAGARNTDYHTQDSNFTSDETPTTRVSNEGATSMVSPETFSIQSSHAMSTRTSPESSPEPQQPVREGFILTQPSHTTPFPQGHTLNGYQKCATSLVIVRSPLPSSSNSNSTPSPGSTSGDRGQFLGSSNSGRDEMEEGSDGDEPLPAPVPLATKCSPSPLDPNTVARPAASRGRKGRKGRRLTPACSFCHQRKIACGGPQDDDLEPVCSDLECSFSYGIVKRPMKRKRVKSSKPVPSPPE
ncbi:hypothetical protein BDN72DRAFT_904770, partial [Pluteus cervinus]